MLSAESSSEVPNRPPLRVKSLFPILLTKFGALGLLIFSYVYLLSAGNRLRTKLLNFVVYIGCGFHAGAALCIFIWFFLLLRHKTPFRSTPLFLHHFALLLTVFGAITLSTQFRALENNASNADLKSIISNVASSSVQAQWLSSILLALPLPFILAKLSKEVMPPIVKLHKLDIAQMKLDLRALHNDHAALSLALTQAQQFSSPASLPMDIKRLQEAITEAQNKQKERLARPSTAIRSPGLGVKSQKDVRCNIQSALDSPSVLEEKIER